MKVLLIGGTGNISSSITKRCLERGDEVWLFNRGNNREFEAMGAHYIIGNAMDPADLKAKLEGHWFDVAANFIIYRFEDCVSTYEALKGRVGQFFYISSCTVYQKPCFNTPITPDTPLKNPYSAYAQTKIKGELYFNERYREDDFPAVIVRPSHTYGEKKLVVGPLMGWGVPHWTLADRILKGQPIIVHGTGRSLWTATHSDDFAYAFCGLMGNQRAIGHSFHITNDEAMTWDMIMNTYGLVLGQTIGKNISLADLKRISHAGVLNLDLEIEETGRNAKQFGVKCSSIFQEAGNLSGGNQQKVVLAKWMFNMPDVLILDEPTRGIDVGAKYDIYCIINELAAAGKCILVISSELPEILGICDRVYVMNEGEIKGEMPIEEANQESIMRLLV